MEANPAAMQQLQQQVDDLRRLVTMFYRDVLDTEQRTSIQHHLVQVMRSSSGLNISRYVLSSFYQEVINSSDPGRGVPSPPYLLYFAAHIMDHDCKTRIFYMQDDEMARIKLRNELVAAQKDALCFTNESIIRSASDESRKSNVTSLIRSVRRKLASAHAELAKRDVLLRIRSLFPVSVTTSPSLVPLSSSSDFLIDCIQSVLPYFSTASDGTHFLIHQHSALSTPSQKLDTFYSALCMLEVLATFSIDVLNDVDARSDMLLLHRNALRNVLKDSRYVSTLTQCLHVGVQLPMVRQDIDTLYATWLQGAAPGSVPPNLDHIWHQVESIQESCVYAIHTLIRKNASVLPEPQIGLNALKALQMATLDVNDSVACAALTSLSEILGSPGGGSSSLLQLLRGTNTVTLASLLSDSLIHLLSLLMKIPELRHREQFGSQIIQYAQSIITKHVVLLSSSGTGQSELLNCLGLLMKLTREANADFSLFTSLLRFWEELVKNMSEQENESVGAANLRTAKEFLRPGLLELAQHLIFLSSFSSNRQVIEGLEDWSGDEEEDEAAAIAASNQASLQPGGRAPSGNTGGGSALLRSSSIVNRSIAMAQTLNPADDEKELAISERKEYIYGCVSVVSEICNLFSDTVADPLASMIVDKLSHSDTLMAEDLTTYFRLTLNIIPLFKPSSPSVQSLLEMVLKYCMNTDYLASLKHKQVKILFRVVSSMLDIVNVLPEPTAAHVASSLGNAVRMYVLFPNQSLVHLIDPATELLADICTRLKVPVFNNQAPVQASEILKLKESLGYSLTSSRIIANLSVACLRAILTPHTTALTTKISPDEWNQRALFSREFMREIFTDYIQLAATLQSSGQGDAMTEPQAKIAEHAMFVLRSIVASFHGELSSPRDALWFASEELVQGTVQHILPRVQFVNIGCTCSAVLYSLSEIFVVFRRHLGYLPRSTIDCVFLLLAQNPLGFPASPSGFQGADQVCLALIHLVKEELAEGSIEDKEWLVSPALEMCRWVAGKDVPSDNYVSVPTLPKYFSDLRFHACQVIEQLLIRHWLYFFPSDVVVPKVDQNGVVVRKESSPIAFVAMIVILLEFLNVANDIALFRQSLQVLSEGNNIRRLFLRDVFLSNRMNLSVLNRLLIVTVERQYSTVQDDIDHCICQLACSDWDWFYGSYLGQFIQSLRFGPQESRALLEEFRHPTTQAEFQKALRVLTNDVNYYRMLESPADLM